jgi:transposase-like protein
MAGTIFQDSATSLKLWFYAMYLMASTRCGISAKQLERELGVTYKTAWRMFNKIRSLMYQDGEVMDGEVEADEAYIGGMAKWKKNAQRKAGIKSGRPAAGSGKMPIFGLAQRAASGKHGRVLAAVVPNTSASVLLDGIEARVLDKATVYTDEYHPYDRLRKRGYVHKRVHHSQNVYVDGDAHTNTIEGFWSLLKRGISGVYHGVSTKHLQAYLDEYAFRYNNRDAAGWGMFSALMDRVRKAPA